MIIATFTAGAEICVARFSLPAYALPGRFFGRVPCFGCLAPARAIVAVCVWVGLSVLCICPLLAPLVCS